MIRWMALESGLGTSPGMPTGTVRRDGCGVERMSTPARLPATQVAG